MAQAREGIFPLSAIDKLTADMKERYFETRASAARVAPLLREKASWKVADLFAGIESGPFDLILWRNMSIYLKPESADKIWRGLIAELSPGGFLVTGKADHPPSGSKVERFAACVYRRTDD